MNCTSHIRFFKMMNRNESFRDLNMHFNFCSALDYRYMKQGQVVFKIGDKSDAFYIILSGGVTIFLPKTKDEMEKPLIDGEGDINEKPPENMTINYNTQKSMKPTEKSNY